MIHKRLLLWETPPPTTKVLGNPCKGQEKSAVACPSPLKSGDVAPKTKAGWKYAWSSQVISTMKKHSGFQNFCNYANMARNLLKPYEDSSRRENVLGQTWLCGLYLSTAKKTDELNRHYDEPQSFSLLQNWNLSLKFLEGKKIKGQLFTSIYSKLYHSALNIGGYIIAFLPSAKK